MQTPEQYSQLRSISVDVQTARPNTRHTHTKNAGSDLMPRKKQLKIIKLDQPIIPSAASANIVNIEFVEENMPVFKRVFRKPSRRPHNPDDKKIAILQRQSLRNRYHNLFRDTNDNFSPSTMQIGPCAISIMPDQQLTDVYARRKLINIQKLAFPLREARRENSTKTKYKTLMNKTSRTHSKGDSGHIKSRRNKSYIEHDIDLSERNLFQENNMHSGSDYKLILDHNAKTEYKKQISSLIPIRKPSNKKDYFVFGLSDKNFLHENKIEMYRDLLWKVNYSNGLYVTTPENLIMPYKFYVGEGNNSNLIRGIMRRRFWWTQASNKNQQGINFAWTQLKINQFFSTQESAAIPEYFVIESLPCEIHRVVSSKGYKEVESDHNRKLFGRLDYKIWKKHIEKNEKSQRKISESTYQKRIGMYEKKRITKVEDSRSILLHNHLEANFYIGNKKALYYNLKRYLELKEENPFNILPLTFHITKGVEDPEFSKFLNSYAAFEEQKKVKKNIRNIWIVKPGQNTNRGKGITVCYNIDDILIRLKGRERNADGKLRTFILQKYIENPLLYNKRKFDLRHYVLITCVNGAFKGYWYEQGYVRTSSAEFNLKASKDPLIHLTNDAIQKHTPDYGKFQKGNKLSYADLQKYLQTSFSSKKINFYEHIIPKMKHFATEAIKATYFILDPNRRKHNFELLGLDFMIDEELEPWLIEINTNPCLELCCPLLQRLIPSLIQNTFKICIDPLFPPPENWPNNRKAFFGDDPISENRFQIIFDENSEGKEIEKLLNGKEKVDSKMGKIQEDDQTFQNEGQVDWQKAQ